MRSVVLIGFKIINTRPITHEQVGNTLRCRKIRFKVRRVIRPEIPRRRRIGGIIEVKIHQHIGLVANDGIEVLKACCHFEAANANARASISQFGEPFGEGSHRHNAVNAPRVHMWKEVATKGQLWLRRPRKPSRATWEYLRNSPGCRLLHRHIEFVRDRQRIEYFANLLKVCILQIHLEPVRHLGRTNQRSSRHRRSPSQGSAACRQYCGGA